MSMTLLCAELRNYFCKDNDKYIGDYSIVAGRLTPSLLIEDGQYYRIVGSIYNDGVHKMGDAADILEDEGMFHGGVWLMRVPKAVIMLSDEIDDWIDKYSNGAISPYKSESFGGYSYTKESGKNGNMSWQDAFATRLSTYRRARI